MTASLERFSRVLADRYRISREIGRGGMATVYEAEDLKHGRPVAIKVVHPALSRGQRDAERFLREIRIAARLNHPQVLPLHDSGQCEGFLYYVMPLVGGESLRARLLRESRLSVDEAVRVVCRVAAALDYAHRQGVLHRDIKPENILFHEGEVMIADFGVALALTASMEEDGAPEAVTDRGVAVGTPVYMSPEQATADRELDGRSDQYGLACVLYELLAGSPPFEGPNARAVMAKHAIEPPAPLRTRRANVPGGIAAAVERALAKDPAQRFPTVSDFAAALVANEPPAVAAPPAPEAGAIAVLPLVNASPDPGTEYLSDGITDELITSLARVDGLRVASRTSVFALKGRPLDVREVGEHLGVTTVLEGTVRTAGRRLRLTAQLTSTRDGRTLWSERYDRQIDDVLVLQEEIAQTIVATLRATLLADVRDPVPRRYTESATAYQLYLKGRFYWNRRTQADIQEAVRCFEAAIAEDPGFALAHTGLADAHAMSQDYRGAPVHEGMERAKAEARRALALDDGLAEAHTSLAWVTFIYDWNWEEAAKEFQRAIAIDPRYGEAHQWYAWLLMALGRTEESLAEGRVGVSVNPGSAAARRSLAWLHYYARQYETSVDHLRRSLALDPMAEESLLVLGLSCTQLGRYGEAEAALREAIRSGTETARARAALGHLALREGRPEKARAIMEELHAASEQTYVSPVNFVGLHLQLGESDLALDWLERAYAERRGWLAYLRVEPLLDPLRGHPRFEALVRRMRLD